MLYVQQSLSPNERIVHVGRFHWFYTASAFTWLFIGAVLSYLVLHVSIYIDVSTAIDHRFPNLPQAMEGKAWDSMVKAKGGLFSIISNLPLPVKLGSFAMFLFGVFMFAKMIITMMVTEIAVTNQRLIYKTGLISRYVGEISVDRIEGINVLQSILGRIFGYGSIVVRGMGVGEVALPPIANPILFRRAIEKARTM